MFKPTQWSTLDVFAVDPGPVPGLAWLSWFQADADALDTPWGLTDVGAVQGSPELVEQLLRRLIGERPAGEPSVILAVERFIPSRMGGARNAPGASARTDRMAAGLVSHWSKVDGVAVVSYPAAPVKLWATDRRLAKILDPASLVGCAHARDALRHAAYASVKAGGMADPLSASFLPNAQRTAELGLELQL